MGIYLSTPKTDKFSEDGENCRLKYGLSSMQGWRATMEDAVSKQIISVFHSFFIILRTIKFCVLFLYWGLRIVIDLNFANLAFF